MATAATIDAPVEKLHGVEERIVRNIRSTLREVAGAADPANLARLTGIAFRQEFPVAKADNCLANALARGITVRQKLMEAEGGSLSAEEAAREIGISKTATFKILNAQRSR